MSPLWLIPYLPIHLLGACLMLVAIKRKKLLVDDFDATVTALIWPVSWFWAVAVITVKKMEEAEKAEAKRKAEEDELLKREGIKP